jgi:hypothetical protein
MTRYAKMLCLWMLVPISVSAQTPAKIDILKAMNEIPTPPASVQDAFSKSICTEQSCKSDELFTAFESDWQSAQNQWKVLNQAQVRQVDSAKQLANSMKSSVGQSTTQQLEAAKQNIPGANQNVMSFAQQMQDPAFKQKFMAMTTEQKMALMQSGGVIATPSNPAIDSDTGITKTKQDFQQKMMSDPAFAAKWKNMSPADQDAYMKQQFANNGTDWNAVAARSRANAAAHPDTTTKAATGSSSSTSDLMTIDDTPIPAATPATALKQQSDAAMTALLNFTITITAATVHIDSILATASAKVQSAIMAHDQQIQSSGASQGEGGVSDPKGDRAIELQYITLEISDVNKALAGLNNAFKSDKSQLNSILGSFDKGLIANQYGQTFTTNADQSTLTGIAQTQIRGMTYMDQIEMLLKEIYPQIAYLVVKQNQIQNEK